MSLCLVADGRWRGAGKRKGRVKGSGYGIKRVSGGKGEFCLVILPPRSTCPDKGSFGGQAWHVKDGMAKAMTRWERRGVNLRE